jgi:phosphotransferase system enzyme I (PtsI)
MIETPSAAMIADHLAPHVDFFSIGTNDLIQYTLAVDRVNEHVSYLYEPMHPAILRLMKAVASAGESHGVTVSICGEMAGDAEVVPILLSLGFQELSMHSTAVPEVKRVIRESRVASLRQVCEEILGAGSADAVRRIMRRLARPPEN